MKGEDVTAPSEEQPSARPLRCAAAGALTAAVAGAAVCFAGVFVPGPATEAGGAPDALGSAVRAAALLLPAFAVVGSLAGLAYSFLVRHSLKARGAVRRMLPLGWVAGVFAYGVAWRMAARDGPPDLRFLEAMAAGAVLGGAAAYVGLFLLARCVARRRPAALGPVLAIGLAAAWVGALAVVLLPPQLGKLPAGTVPGRNRRPNVLLIVLDTVRADRMSCYGCERKTTPNIDEFAKDAMLYKNVLSPGGWTLPGHASIFTGLPVSAHGCTWAYSRLDVHFDTLAELLRADGYQTVGLSSNVIITPEAGFSQGFRNYWVPSAEVLQAYKPTAPIDRLVERLAPRLPTSLAEAMHEELAAWFETEYRPDEPFLIFLNYIEPHLPYDPPWRHLHWAGETLRRKWRAKFDWKLFTHYNLGLGTLSDADLRELSLLYDEEIAYVDFKVGELLDWLREHGFLENTMIAITADHGEHLGEHHLVEHHYSLYEPVARVPMIVRYPGVFDAGVHDDLVQTHDLFPTILELAGTAWTPSDAHNCRSLIGMGSDPGRMGIAEFLPPTLKDTTATAGALPVPPPDRFHKDQRAVQVGPMKMIRWAEDERELYDVAQDPLETRDLAAARAEDLARLAAALGRWIESFVHYDPLAGSDGPMQRTATELEALKALGYVH